jgi:hypothetical protein
MKSIMCALGIHKWKIVRKRKMFSGARTLVKVDAIRKCERCNKKQKEDYMCLGLNPARFHSDWYDIN